jgi:type I restriction enzyme M protein
MRLFANMSDVSGEEIDNLKIVEDLCSKKSSYDELKKEKDGLENTLETKIQEEYSKLSEKDIKLIVVEKKWLNFLTEQFEGEIEKISYELGDGVQSLVERYESTLPGLLNSVASLEKSVSSDLESMGFSWN